MTKQEYKITTELGDVFFFEHSMQSAYYHADKYIDRNKGKLTMNLYRVNNGVGNRWVFIGSF